MDKYIKKHHKVWLGKLINEGLSPADSEDILQTAYLSLYKWLSKGKVVESKGGLMYSIIARSKADHFRKQYASPFVPSCEEGEVFSSEHVYANEEEFEQFVTKIGEEKYSGVLADVLIGQYTYAQTAERHSLKHNHVKEIVKRWRKKNV